MIGYIDKKNINYKRIKELLSISAKINHFSNSGPLKKLLESKLESIIGINLKKKVICFNNGTSALHALMMYFTKKGVKKWVTPAFTFPSVVVGGAFDVDILDINPNTITLPLDETALEKYDGVIITNVFGCDVGVENWHEFCKKQNKVLIFDNASSPLTKTNNINVCNFGDASFGSLHHTKYLGFGEGGFAIVNEDLYNDLEAISNFGFLHSRTHENLSSNFKISDISAAFIIQHLENYNIEHHINIQNELINGISEINNVYPLLYNSETVYGNLPIVFSSKIDNVYFQNSNIVTQKYYKPLKNLPNSIDLYDRIVNFPLYENLTNTNIKTIIKSIKAYEEI